MVGIIVIGNLLSKFKVVMSYFSGEKGEGIFVNGIMLIRIIAGMQRMYCVGEGCFRYQNQLGYGRIRQSSFSEFFGVKVDVG